MQALRTSEQPSTQGQRRTREEFVKAWLAFSSEAANAAAIVELIWQSMSDNDPWGAVPAQYQGLRGLETVHRCALDAVGTMIKAVALFFDEFDYYGSSASRQPSGSNHFGQAADNYDEMQMRIDEWQELCNQFAAFPEEDHATGATKSEMTAHLDRCSELQRKILAMPCRSIRDVLLKVDFSDKALGQNDPAGQGLDYFAIVRSLKGLRANA